MARPLRIDGIGTVHHLTNRAGHQRPIYETRPEIRYFLSLVAHGVRDGLIRVMAYSVLSTHFHLILESVTGELSRTLQGVEARYASRFNLLRGRAGYLYGCRFWSRPLDTVRYFWNALWYVDRNPVEAGLLQNAEEYPYGSAKHYARGSGPLWLDRSRVETALARRAAVEVYTPDLYLRALARGGGRGRYEVMDRIARSPSLRLPSEFDDLVGAAPKYVQDWLAANAARADGCPTHIIVTSLRTLRAVVHEFEASGEGRALTVSGQRGCPWEAVEAGLLHGACGIPLAALATVLGVSKSAVHRRVLRHREALSTSKAYLEVAAEALRRAITIDFGDGAADGAPLAPAAVDASRGHGSP